MSIYSGFATRIQEQTYDSCVESLIYVLQKRIIKFYQNQPADQVKFMAVIAKLYSQLKGMESNKYLDPKSSLSFGQLNKYLLKNQKMIISNSQNISLPNLEHKNQGNESGKSNNKNSMWVARTNMQQATQTMGTLVGEKLKTLHEDKQKTKTSNIGLRNNNKIQLNRSKNPLTNSSIKGQSAPKKTSFSHKIDDINKIQVEMSSRVKGDKARMTIGIGMMGQRKDQQKQIKNQVKTPSGAVFNNGPNVSGGQSKDIIRSYLTRNKSANNREVTALNSGKIQDYF